MPAFDRDDSDSANLSTSVEVNEIPRRSQRQTKPTNRLNLATWMCFVATMPQLLINIKDHQTTVLTTHYNHEIYTSTSDNLINDMHPFSFATGYAENEAFHLGQMITQEDRKYFVVAMKKETSEHNNSKH